MAEYKNYFKIKNQSDSSKDAAQKQKGSPINNDKENFNVNKRIKTSWLPKRVSELSPLESDFDGDKQDDELNCSLLALKDSFILTPNQSLEIIDYMTPIDKNNKKTPEKLYEDIALNTKMHLQKNFIIKQISFPDTPPKLAANQEKKPFREISLKNNNDFTPLYPKKKIATIKDRIDINLSEICHGVPHYLSSSSSRLKSGNSLTQREAYQKETKVELEPPLRTTNKDFVIPQFNKLQVPTVTHRLRPIIGNKIQKRRLRIQEEFPSQILFTTSVSSCPPMPPSAANDNITLPLDDKIKAPQFDSKNTELKKKKPENDNFNQQRQEDVTQTIEKVISINGKEFFIHKEIGSGTFSLVFAVVQKNNKRDCALKIVTIPDGKAASEYLNETEILAKLQGNGNVVALYEYDYLPNLSKLYMVMEKGDSDLYKILQSYITTIPLYTLVNYWYQILQSVKYVHENGVIHCDLKPSNFLVVNGRLKLIDFGIAITIPIGSTSVIKFTRAGTPEYISPEALIDTSTGNNPLNNNPPQIKLSTKSDVWSLGCILYLLLYKKTPFSHIINRTDKFNAITDPATEIIYPEMQNFYPPMLIEMAKKCLQHNANTRISVPELLHYPFNMVIPIDSIK